MPIEMSGGVITRQGDYHLGRDGWEYVNPNTGERIPLGRQPLYHAGVPPAEQAKHKPASDEVPGVRDASLTVGGTTFRLDPNAPLPVTPTRNLSRPLRLAISDLWKGVTGQTR